MTIANVPPNLPTITWAASLDPGHHSFSKWAMVCVYTYVIYIILLIYFALEGNSRLLAPVGLYLEGPLIIRIFFGFRIWGACICHRDTILKAK